VKRAAKGLKFNECLPDEAAVELLRARTSDRAGVLRALAEPLAYAT
jgi:hypothetical protein